MKRSIWVAVLGLAVGVQAGRADDWPQWRGPDRNGISKETGWFATGAVAKTVWKASVGAGYSSVAVSGGKLYTMGNEKDKDAIVCLNAVTGAEQWRYEYPCRSGSHAGPRCTPAVSDGKVYALSREGMLVCLDAKDGSEKWKRDLAKEQGAEAPGWGFASSPLLRGTRVIVNVGGSGTAVDKDSGEPVWKSGGKGAGYASAVPLTVMGKPALALFAQKGLIAVDEASGARLWEHAWSTSYDVNAPDPVVVGDKVLITSGYGRGAALLDVAGAVPKVVWENKSIASQFSSVVLLDGHLYGITGNTGGGELRCIKADTGEVKWSYGKTGFGSLIMADGKLIVLNEQGTIFVVKVATEACSVLWEGKVHEPTCWTMPALANGLIYCRNAKGNLVAVDLRGR